LPGHFARTIASPKFVIDPSSIYKDHNRKLGECKSKNSHNSLLNKDLRLTLRTRIGHAGHQKDTKVRRSVAKKLPNETGSGISVHANGRLLTKARKQLGFKQETVAKAAGISVKTVCRYEGDGRAELDKIKILEAYLKSAFAKKKIRWITGPLWFATRAEWQAAQDACPLTVDELPGEGLELLESWGWDCAQLVKHLQQLNFTWSKDLYTFPDEIATPEKWARILKAYPRTWRIFVDDTDEATIIGHWNFLPLNDREFARLKEGVWIESQLDFSMVDPMVMKGEYNMYFVLVASDPKYHRTLRGGRMLFDSITSTVQALAEEGVFFNQVCAKALTPEGLSLCTHFKLSQIAKGSGEGVWAVRLRDYILQPEKRRSHPRLAKLYAEHFCS
jgi:transcriptional regulator with XRE-family HTH domain